jgi:hypothetical protein
MFLTLAQTAAENPTVINWTLGIILLICNIPVYVMLGWMMFGNADNFLEAIRFLVTPDIISALRGEGWEDWWQEIKLLVLFILCFICVAGEYVFIIKNFY